jgi:carboxyl-terminal processing protease
MHRPPNSEERRLNKTTIKGVIRSVAASGLLCLYSAQMPAADTDEHSETPAGPAQLTLDDLRTFTDVFNQVRRNYVERVDDRSLLNAAIRGMLMDLDPHSAYLPGRDFRDLEDNSQGRYSGIGVDVQVVEGQIVVRAVITDSPADLAGLNPGDSIISIDGAPVTGRYLPDAIDDLAGEPGTEVELVVLTPQGEERSVSLVREYLTIPTLGFELLENSWGYFRISLFHQDSAADLEQSLSSIRADGIELRGIVLDLRNNPGGVLQGAVQMADGFLDEGLIVTTRGRDAAMQMEFRASPGQWLPDAPLLILVDRGSASASEVLAGALQDNGRALIVGERSFGKGSVQTVLPLRNGGGIKLTTARYYTPSGRSIQAEGIQPDVVYAAGGSPGADPGRKREADLERHLSKETGSGMEATAHSALRDGFPLNEALRVLEDAGILVAGDPAAEPQASEQ